MGLIVKGQVWPPFGENSWLVADEESGEALLIDPGGPPPPLAKGQRILAIVATHGHIDHVAFAEQARRDLGAPFWGHAGDRGYFATLAAQANMFGFPPVESPTVDRWLEDGDEIRLGKALGRVIHTPGHTAGGLCLFFPEEKVLFTGDTLFAGSIGRTDLPGGDSEVLLRSIRERLLGLGDAVEFYPGHGPGGSLGEERRHNPFVGLGAGPLR
jgi:glyoxylase-like metal-dependent hydrolase (beta-lactamase superfamily II)